MNWITRSISAVVGTISLAFSFFIGNIVSGAVENATVSLAEKTSFVHVPLLQLTFFLVGIASWVLLFLDIWDKWR